MKKTKWFAALILAVTAMVMLCSCQSKTIIENEVPTNVETIPTTEPVLETAEFPEIEELVAEEPEKTFAETETTEDKNGGLPSLPAEAQHEHSYTETIITMATCTRSGQIKYECSCGHSYREETLKEQHIYISQAEAPTCTEEGYITYTCKICADTYVDNLIPAIGHSYEETVIEPACTADGYTIHTCSTCGDVYFDGDTSSIGHSWGDWTILEEPTEVSTGTKTRSCRRCGATDTDIIPAIEHSHSYTHITTKPTCILEGYITHTCCTCGHSYVDSYVPALGHTWGEWAEVIAPTESSEGLKERFCITCSVQETEPIPRIESSHTHSYSVTERINPTCEQTGYSVEVCYSCGDCKIVTLPALGHTWIHHHEDEQGHYDVYIKCHCGWYCSADIDYITAFAAHVNSVDPENRYDHSYYDYAVWVVDVPARDWDICSVCGVTK